MNCFQLNNYLQHKNVLVSRNHDQNNNLNTNYILRLESTLNIINYKS